MIFQTINGRPISPIMQRYFCTKEVANNILKQAQALAPNIQLVDKTDDQTIGQMTGTGFFWDGNPPEIRFYELIGTVEQGEMTFVIDDNVGFLSARFKDRGLQAGLDHATTQGDKLGLQILPVGIAQFYWGA